MSKSYSFHFSCGNSTVGPIGFCAAIRAETPQEALTTLREILPSEFVIPADDDRVEYARAYLSVENVSSHDIDMVDDRDVAADDIDKWEGRNGSAPAPDLPPL